MPPWRCFSYRVCVRPSQPCSPNHLLHILQRGVEEALLLVERAHLPHLPVGQLEVENLDVLPDVVGIRSAGDDGETLLDVPAQDDLCRGLAVGFGYLLYHGVMQQRTVAHRAAQREPAFHLDALRSGLPPLLQP